MKRCPVCQNATLEGAGALTLGELSIGDHFVLYPLDGDDSGHGGLKSGSYIWRKIEPVMDQKYPSLRPRNAQRLLTSGEGHMTDLPDTIPVIKIVM